MRSRGVLPLAALLMAGCADFAAEQAARAPSLLRGLPRERLLACAGTPGRSLAEGDAEYLTYSSRRVVAYPRTEIVRRPVRRRDRAAEDEIEHVFRYEYGSASCRATFVLRQGVVDRLVYGGDEPDGPQRLAQCYAIVGPCLPGAAEPPDAAPAGAAQLAPAPAAR